MCILWNMEKHLTNFPGVIFSWGMMLRQAAWEVANLLAIIVV